MTHQNDTTKTCSFEGCWQQALFVNRQVALLGKDEARGQFVFRLYHSCLEHILYYARSTGEDLFRREKQFGQMRMFFLVTPHHLALARRLTIHWYDSQAGAPGASIFRPYGNSDVLSDIADAVGSRRLTGDDNGYSPDEEASLERLHREMHLVLQIILHTGQMQPGIYKKPSLTNEWIVVKHPEVELELLFASSEQEVPQPQVDLRDVLSEIVRRLSEEGLSQREIHQTMRSMTIPLLQEMNLSPDDPLPTDPSWSVSTLITDVLENDI